MSVQRTKLVFATDKPTEHAYAQCDNLRQIIADRSKLVEVSLVPGYSTIHCLPYLSENADLGFIKNFEIALASGAQYPYAKTYSNIRAVMNIGSRGGVFHFGVDPSTGMDSFRKIAENRYPLSLVVPEPAASSYHMTRFALEGYGITFEKIFEWGGRVTIELGGRAHLLGVTMMKKGDANSISGSDYYPSIWISESGREKGINLLSMDKEVVDEVCQRYGLVKWVIPKEAYPFLKSDVLSFKDVDIVATRASVPEEIIYDFTKTICESADRVRALPADRFFDPKTAWQNIGLLHSGAEKYYREMGYI